MQATLPHIARKGRASICKEYTASSWLCVTASGAFVRARRHLHRVRLIRDVLTRVVYHFPLALDTINLSLTGKSTRKNTAGG